MSIHFIEFGSPFQTITARHFFHGKGILTRQVATKYNQYIFWPLQLLAGHVT